MLLGKSPSAVLPFNRRNEKTFMCVRNTNPDESIKFIIVRSCTQGEVTGRSMGWKLTCNSDYFEMLFFFSKTILKGHMTDSILIGVSSYSLNSASVKLSVSRIM